MPYHSVKGQVRQDIAQTQLPFSMTKRRPRSADSGGQEGGTGAGQEVKEHAESSCHSTVCHSLVE